MRTRTRTDSPVEQRLDLSWDTPSADTPPVETSPDQGQKPQDISTASSEPVFPSSSIESSPASSKDTESAPSTVSSSPDELAVASTSVPAKQETPETASPTDVLTSPIAEDAPRSTQEASQVSSPSEPSCPALPSETPEPPLPAESAIDVKEFPAEAPDTSIVAHLQETSPEETSSDKPVENPRATPKPPRKPALPVNIIPKDEPVGVVLARKRQEANVKIEDLAKRLNISEFVIRYLETGDYDGLCRTFGENNCIYIIFNFKSIGEELGMSKNEIDDLVEKLTKEIAAAGLKLDAPVKHDDDAPPQNSIGRRRPVKSVLPKLIVFTLFIVCILIFFLAVVVPYVTKRRPHAEKRVDFLPLIEQPWKSMRTVPPQQLPIP